MADRKAFDAIFGKQSALTPDPLARPDSPTARFLAERYAVGDAPTSTGYYGGYRTDPENKVEERGIILPGAKYSDGKIHPAWPAIVHDAWQGMKAFETADPTDNSPDATARLSKAAFDAAGLAMTGSLAVPRPSNAVGTFGGKLAKATDQPSAGDFLKERYGSSTSGAGPTGSAVNDPAVQAKSFWDAVKPLDSKLDGTAARAMDEWIGGPHDIMARGLEGGPMMPARLEGLPPQQLDVMAAPVRDLLRQTYGDTITVYRGELPGGKPSTGRTGALMSYTTDPQVAERFAGSPGKAVPLISDAEIAAAERQLATAGEVSIAGKTYRQQPGQKYVDIIDRDGNFVTDTDSLRTELAGINEWRAGRNAQRDAALKNVRAVELPVDQVVWATDRAGQKEIIARTGGGDGAITLPPMRDAPSDPAQYIKTSDYDKALNTPYASGASSRQVPFSGPLPPVGSWRMADRTGLYGRDIEHLRQFDANDLLLPEIREGKLDPTKRGDDARYADWMREGKKPPPIEVLQMDDGRFRVMDGHRRALAAQQAGQPIEAWVSYSVPTGKVDAYGNPMKTSLTYELAHPTVDRTAASTPQAGSLNQTTSPQDFLRERYGADQPEPLRGYHGASMPYEGDAYNPRKSQYKAFFGAERPELANNFARSYGDNPRVYPVEVSPSANMFNPANPEHSAKIVAAFDKNPGMLSGFLMGKDTLRRMLAEGDGGLMESAGVQQWLRKNKFDGWRFQDTAAPPSADDKRGAFGMLKPGFVRSSTTGDLLYSNPKESAALPSAVKALENRALPMDLESQLARAKDMEFDTRLYHGTNAQVDNFELGRTGYNSTIFGSEPTTRHAIFAAEHPELASEFAIQHGVDGARVMPLIARTGNVLDLTKEGFWALPDSFFERHGQNPRFYRNMPLWETWQAFDGDGAKDFVRALQADGYTSAKLMDVSSGDVANTTSYAFFDPTDLRSTTATFDPAQSHSANLLASNPKTSAAVPVGVKAVEGNAAKNAATHAADDYRGQHGAPDHESGSPLHDVTANGIYPSDFYGPMGRRYYGTGDDEMDRVAFDKIMRMKDKPDELVPVWRAIPEVPGKKKGLTLNSSHINPGDWVAISRQYAVDHGESALNGKYHLVKGMKPARELFTAGDSIHEWGWSPRRPTSE